MTSIGYEASRDCEKLKIKFNELNLIWDCGKVEYNKYGNIKYPVIIDFYSRTKDNDAGAYIKKNCSGNTAPTTLIENAKNHEKKEYLKAKAAGAISPEQTDIHKKLLSVLNEYQKVLHKSDKASDPYEAAKNLYNAKTVSFKNMLNTANNSLSNVFVFLSEVYGTGDEILIFMTELTQNNYSSDFLDRYGNSEYAKYDKKLMLHRRKPELRTEIESLELQDEA